MERIVASETHRGKVSLPSRVRRELGLRSNDKVVFTIEDGQLRLEPVRLTAETLFGSIPAIPGTTTEDFERQIAAAMSDAADETVREMRPE